MASKSKTLAELLNGDVTIDATDIAAGSVTSAKLATQTGNVDFADNARIRLGDSQDLQIFHDGSNSWINEVGTGQLILAGEDVRITTPNAGEFMATFGVNGAATLYYDNAAKIATTGTGVDVTGTVTADGLTVDGTSRFNNYIHFGGSISTPSTAAAIYRPVDNQLAFSTANTERMRIDNNGNVGIGNQETTVFNGAGGDMKFVVTGSDNATTVANNSDAGIAIVNTDTTAGNLAGLHFARADTDDTPCYAGASIVARFPDAQVTGQYPAGQLIFLTSSNANAAPSEKVRIASGGQVGFNTSTPNTNAIIHVSGNGAPNANMGHKGLMLSYSSGNSAPIYFGTETNASAKAIYMRSFYMTIRGHDNEGIKFDGSGSSVTRYQFNMGNNGNTCFNASNSSNWNTSSDSRIKENVQSLPDGAIEKIKALRPVTFDYTDDWATQKGWFNYTASEDDPHDLTENGFNLDQKNNDIGWIAQEYETVFPKDVKNKTETVDGVEVDDFKTVKPDSVVPYLVKALQEALDKIETLESRLNDAGL